MSENSTLCDYVLDPDDPRTWGGEEDENWLGYPSILNEDGVWPCPHESEKDSDLCIFHSPLGEKDNAAVIDAFTDAVELAIHEDASDEEQRKSQFLSALFPSLNLIGQQIDFESERAHIDLSYSTVDGDLIWDHSNVDILCNLRNITINGEAKFTRVEFEGGATFRGSEFNKDVDFVQADFATSTDFSNTTFGGEASFAGAQFRDGAFFNNSTFSKYADFRAVEFHDAGSFHGVEFQQDVDFNLGEFEYRGFFVKARFQGESSFVDVKFGEYTNFQQAEFYDPPNFREAMFRGKSNFSELPLSNADFHGADLTDTTFTNSDLCDSDLESALLSRATLFGADLRGARLSGAVLGDIRIDDDTRFLGPPTDEINTSSHTLAAIFSKPRCVYDPNYAGQNEYEDVDLAKSVYRTLEEIGGRTARPRLQARCFVRRKDLQKMEYWNDATKLKANTEEKLIASTRWLRLRMSELVLLYGESPWRILGASFTVIVGFAMTYPIGGWMQPRGGTPIYYSMSGSIAHFGNSIYYSTLTFTALGFGDFQPVGFGRILTTIETGLGAVLLALLVYVFGRRAAR